MAEWCQLTQCCVTVAQFIHDNSLCCGRVCPCQLGRDVMAQFVSTNSLCLSTVCPSQLAHSVVAEFIHASYYIQAVKSLDVHHCCATWNHQDAVEVIKNILIIAILFIYIHLTCKQKCTQFCWMIKLMLFCQWIYMYMTEMNKIVVAVKLGHYNTNVYIP